jgi:hypothetical protein
MGWKSLVNRVFADQMDLIPALGKITCPALRMDAIRISDETETQGLFSRQKLVTVVLVFGYCSFIIIHAPDVEPDAIKWISGHLFPRGQ